jgi:hypothetical protein
MRGTCCPRKARKARKARKYSKRCRAVDRYPMGGSIIMQDADLLVAFRAFRGKIAFSGFIAQSARLLPSDSNRS